MIWVLHMFAKNKLFPSVKPKILGLIKAHALKTLKIYRNMTDEFLQMKTYEKWTIVTDVPQLRYFKARVISANSVQPVHSHFLIIIFLFVCHIYYKTGVLSPTTMTHIFKSIWSKSAVQWGFPSTTIPKSGFVFHMGSTV